MTNTTFFHAASPELARSWSPIHGDKGAAVAAVAALAVAVQD